MRPHGTRTLPIDTTSTGCEPEQQIQKVWARLELVLDHVPQPLVVHEAHVDVARHLLARVAVDHHLLSALCVAKALELAADVCNRVLRVRLVLAAVALLERRGVHVSAVRAVEAGEAMKCRAGPSSGGTMLGACISLRSRSMLQEATHDAQKLEHTGMQQHATRQVRTCRQGRPPCSPCSPAACQSSCATGTRAG